MRATHRKVGIVDQGNGKSRDTRIGVAACRDMVSRDFMSARLILSWHQAGRHNGFGVHLLHERIRNNCMDGWDQSIECEKAAVPHPTSGPNPHWLFIDVHFHWFTPDVRLG